MDLYFFGSIIIGLLFTSWLNSYSNNSNIENAVIEGGKKLFKYYKKKKNLKN
jgi:hypothetical protein